MHSSQCGEKFGSEPAVFQTRVALNALIFITLAATMLFLAFFGAGIFAWTVGVAAILLSGIYFAAVRRATPQTLCARPGRFSGIEPTYIALLVFLLLTLVPLPLNWTAGFGSERFRQNVTAAKALEDSSLYLGHAPSQGFAFTRNRAGTLRAVMLVVTMFAAAVLVAMLPVAWKRAYLRFLAGSATAIAVAGYIGQWRIPQGDTLWWVFQIQHYLPGPVGCFINRNHFGGFLALLSPAALTLLADDLSQRRWLRAVTSAVMFATLVAVIVCSLSRGAFVTLLAASTATTLLFLAQRRWITAAVLAAAALVAVVAVAVLLPVPSVRARLHTLQHPADTASAQTRISEWKDTLRVWTAYPIAGTGANALRMAYPQHRTTTASGNLTDAENEYLQVLAETGLIGVFLIGALAVGVWRHAAKPWAAGGSDCAVTVAAWSICCAAAVNAVFEFSLQIPLCAVVLASAVGLLLIRPDPGFEWAGCSSRATPAVRAGLPWAAVLSLLTALALAGDTRRLDSPTLIAQADGAEIRQALAWAPTCWEAWYYLGRQACIQGGKPACVLGERCISQAAACDPNNYRIWRELGKLRLDLKNYRGAKAAFAKAKALRAWVDTPPVPQE